MTTVLWIIGIFAAAGFLFTLLSGGSGKEAVEGAAAGAVHGFGCIVQLLLSVIPILLGLWLFGQIFG